ncbi:phage tailspike protein [Ralstonia insidiosa]|uniref:phage tailspike protein n=1 Tax=Ralstonia insidiosa TaxID=190721 RepID=UPI001427DA56|nr:phage tailspike protein [Ralstonia insidiosa]
MVLNPIAFFTDLLGKPLQGGSVYIGAANTNPLTNPLTVYQDAAMTIPMAQPLKTANGYISLNGSPQPIFVNAASYSLAINDSNGNLTLSIPNYTNPLLNQVGAGGASQIGFDGTTLDQQFLSRANRVVDTVAQLRGLSPTTYTRADMTGYNQVGDWGRGGFWMDNTDTTSADNSVTTFVGVAGARWKLVNQSRVSAMQGGAKGDKSTDDSVAIRNVPAAIKNGATYEIPTAPGDAYIISQHGTDSWCVDFSHVMNIRASGMYGALQPAAGTTVTTVYFKPNPSIANIGSLWEGLALGDPYTGTRAGTNGIFIDTQVNGSQLAKHVFSRLNILSGTGVGILHINVPSGTNANGGMYASSIENSVINGGISLQATGDSNTAHKNLISGPNNGIYLSNAPGASLFTAVDNNITSTGGAFKIDAGSRFKLLRNNCEQISAFTGGATYMCDIAGGNGTMSTAEIRGNHFGLFSGITNSGVIHLSNTVGALISENTILNANTGGVGIVVDANNTNTRIGPNTYGTGVVTKVVDNGIGTMGVIKTITTFANNWQNIGSTAPGRFYKDILGTVHLAGLIALGTTTQGTLMFTLPVGFRPDYPTRHPVLTNNGSGLVAGEIRIDTSGAVTFWYGQNSYVSLDGICFPAAGLADTISDL